MLTTQDITEKYRENLSAFADFLKQLIEICIEEEVTTLSSSVIDGFKELLKEVDMHETIRVFVLISQHSNGQKPFLVWNQIATRSEKHLLQNLENLIEEQYRPRIQPYLYLLNAVDIDGDRIVDEAYRDVLWQFCESFVSLSLKYIHAARRPTKRKDNDGDERKAYTHSYLPEVSNRDVQKYAKKFQVELSW